MIGKIYAIYHDGEIVVVGSTKRTLKQRWGGYKKKVKNPEYKSNTHVTMREYGIDNYEMELLEEVEVENKYQLEEIEGGWQSMFKEFGIKLYNTREARGLQRGTPEYLAREIERNRERRADPEYRAREREIKSQRIECELCGRIGTRGHIREHQRSNYCMENRKKTSVVIRLKK
jgi:hypothetical protein